MPRWVQILVIVRLRDLIKLHVLPLLVLLIDLLLQRGLIHLLLAVDLFVLLREKVLEKMTLCPSVYYVMATEETLRSLLEVWQ